MGREAEVEIVRHVIAEAHIGRAVVIAVGRNVMTVNLRADLFRDGLIAGPDNHWYTLVRCITIYSTPL